ncbi:hypothetical protein AgCh_004287 [Apium graveolens]
MYDCIHELTELTPVSFWICQDLLKASERRRHLESLFLLAPQNVVKTYCVGRLLDDDLASMRSVPDELASLHLEMPSNFNGFQLQMNKIYLCFSELILDDGIRKDLGELYEMLLESEIQGVCERKLFEKLFKEYTRNENGSFTHSSESLRNGSFIITHCPVVWTPKDRYKFIGKLGEYRELDRRLYDLLTNDTFARATFTVDFWTRVDTAEPSSLAFILKPLYTRGKNTLYTNVEAIRSFHKYAYEHKPGSYAVHHKVSARWTT